MPPIHLINHGPARYGPAITRDLIAVQTLENLDEVSGVGPLAFDVVEGLGADPAVGEAIWYIPGDLKRQYMLAEWKYMSSAANRYMGMIARASAPGAGSIGYFLLALKNNNQMSIVSVIGGGDIVNGNGGISDAVELGEIFLQQAWITTDYDANSQTITFEHISHGRVSNTPGAANYNLAAIHDPCNFNLKIDGGATQTIVFASTDALVIANGGLGALTNVGVAAVFNNQLVGGYAIVPTGASYVVIYTRTWSTSGSVDVDAVAWDSNAAFGFPTVAATGHANQLRVDNNNRIRGFSGFNTGHGGNTAQWLRYMSISGV